MSRWRLARGNQPHSATGGRTYAIGDIHGSWNLLAELIQLINNDVEARPRAVPTRLVVLGDFIDRGPHSRRLIDLFMQARVVILKGNHEAALVDAWNGNHEALEMWIDHGGRATLESFGADLGSIAADDWQALMRVTRRTVPAAVIAWLDGLPTWMDVDGHYYVHAGIRPGVPLKSQTDTDRLWIGCEFTRSDADHGIIIVHGHSINEPGVFFGSNRIGVDTGAYRTGRLSAVAIEAGQRWVLQTRSAEMP